MIDSENLGKFLGFGLKIKFAGNVKKLFWGVNLSFFWGTNKCHPIYKDPFFESLTINNMQLPIYRYLLNCLTFY